MTESSIKTLYDFKAVPIPPKLLELRISQQAVEDALLASAEQFLTIQPVVGGITKGDIVAVQVPDAAVEGGNQTLHINVGLGFAGQELESALLGLSQGDEGTVCVAGQPHPFQVVSVKRRIVPTLTDALVQRLGLEGVQDLDAYRNYLLNQQVAQIKKGKMQALCGYVVKEVLSRSEFAPMGPNQPDYQLVLTLTQQQIADQATRSGLPAEQVLAQAVHMAGHPVEECRLALEALCEEQAKRCAIGRAYAAQDGVAFTREDAARRYQVYAPQMGDISLSQAMLDASVVQMYIDHATATIGKYYEDRFQVILCP